MANAIVKMIMLIYRGWLPQFTTTEHAVPFRQRETVTTRWFRKVTADIHFVTDAGVWQAQHLRGHKYAIIEALPQLERAPTPPHA
jgi:hypothetical protein